MPQVSNPYDHKCIVAADKFILTWTVDQFYPSGAFQHAHQIKRVTNERGAKRFCKKWGLTMEMRQ